MVAFPGSGLHFTNPAEFMPYSVPVAKLLAIDSGDASQACSTTAFFTELARRGLQDQTDWTANTYKTLLSVSSGKGFVAAVIGPTAGGAETTTFEITVDGVLSTITVTNAASERACLLSANIATTNDLTSSLTEALDATKSFFTSTRSTATVLPPWAAMRSIPQLKFNVSLLIRAKHSTIITNSTATSYSAVMYRNLVAA